MSYITEDWCARCSRSMVNIRECGDSSLYFPGSATILLCEPCFLSEDDEIEAQGTNNQPTTLHRYLENLKALGVNCKGL